MSSCIYSLKHNDKVYEFNSDEELSSFIINNAQRLSSINVDNNISFSKDYDVQAEAKAKIKKLSDFAATVTYDEYGNKIINSPNRKSVTTAITTLKNEKGQSLVAGFDVEAFREYKVKQLVDEYKLTDTQEFTEEERVARANSEVDQMVENWKILAKLGTGIHAILEEYFNDPTVINADLIKVVRSRPEIKEININDNQIIQAIDFVKAIHNQLEKNYPGAIYMPEVKIKSKEGVYEIVGKIDLLVIDKEGNTHIFDFKASPTNYDDYGKVKNLTHDYQLGFYRQILAQHGFNPMNMDLGIIPIQMLDTDYKNKSFSGISNEARVIVKSSALEENNILAYNGKISKQLNEFIPVANMENISSTELSESIKKLDEKVFKYSSNYKMHISSLENFIKNKIKEKNNKFSFFNVMEDSWNEFPSLEAAKEAAETYLNDLADKQLVLAGAISKEYHKLENNENVSDKVFNEDVKNATFLNKYFHNYLKWGYKLNDSLLSNGILVFYHPGMKTVDFIYINKDDLELQQSFGNQKLITGNLIFDRQAPSNTLKATVGNIELMRLMAAVNEFMPNFNEFKVQDLKVINFHSQKSAIQSTDVLRENWKSLINAALRSKSADIENNFENGKIQITSPTERVLNQVDYILNSSSTSLSVKRFSKKTKDFKNASSNELKIKMLTELLSDLRKEKGQSTKVMDPLAGMAESDPSYLYFIVANAIRELAGLKYIYSLTDLDPKSLHSDLWMDAAHSPNQIINEVNNKVIEKLRLNARERMHVDLSKTKKYTNEWLHKKGKLDTSLNAFDHLIIRNDDSLTFRVKNPYSDPSVTGADKDYLIKWLETINACRYPSTNGDYTTAKAKELIASGAWFNIPPMRGGMINRGLSFNTVKNWWKDTSDRAVNVIEVLTQPQTTDVGTQEQLFETYVNPMMVEGEGVENSTMRDSMLRDKGVNYFSRDLSEIAATMQYYDILSDEYEKALPILRTAIICGHAGALFTGADVSGMLTTMMQKFQTAVYKTQHLSKTEQALYKFYAPLSSMASSITLPFNVFSFVRELMQGKYNNYGRMLSKFGGKDAPDAADLTKAYAFVCGEGIKSGFSESLMNAINLRYGVFGRSLQEQKESHRGESAPMPGQLFKSGSLYWMNGLADYYHRMALFIGHIYKGGFMDAYSVDPETGSLKYDFKKDPRFKNVIAYFKGGKLDSEDKGMETYNMLLESFNKTLPESKQLVFGDDLPDGFSQEQVQSISTLANLIHGNLDSDTQMHARTFFAGKVFLKFINFIGAKATAWTLAGGKYNMYDRQYETDPKTGDPLYIKVLKDENGKVIGTTTTTNYNDSTGQKVVKLTEKYEEGVMYAFKDLWDICTNPENRAEKWEDLKNDEYKMGTLQFHIADLFLFLISGIAALMIDWPELKEEDPASYLVAQALNNTLSENNPISIISTALNGLDPAALKVNTKLLTNTFKVITNENYDTKSYLANTFGFAKVLNFF